MLKSFIKVATAVGFLASTITGPVLAGDKGCGTVIKFPAGVVAKCGKADKKADHKKTD